MTAEPDHLDVVQKTPVESFEQSGMAMAGKGEIHELDTPAEAAQAQAATGEPGVVPPATEPAANGAYAAAATNTADVEKVEPVAPSTTSGEHNSASQPVIDAGSPAAPSHSAIYCDWFADADDIWHISVPSNPEKKLTVRHCVGMAYIQVVLQAHPRALSPTQVQSLAGNENRTASASFAVRPALNSLTGMNESDRLSNIDDYRSPQDAIDSQARREIGERLNSLKQQRAEAERNNDQAQIDFVNRESEEIEKFLNRASGLGGRSRKLPGSQTRSNDAVRTGIRRAIKEYISKKDAAAGQYLKTHIRTGREISYSGPEVVWKFSK
jgi:hypothetical protein